MSDQKAESEEETIFEVEEILDDYDGDQKYYRVKWKDYDEITWEPKLNLTGCKDMVQEYERDKHTKKRKLTPPFKKKMKENSRTKKRRIAKSKPQNTVWNKKKSQNLAVVLRSSSRNCLRSGLDRRANYPSSSNSTSLSLKKAGKQKLEKSNFNCSKRKENKPDKSHFVPNSSSFSNYIEDEETDSRNSLMNVGKNMESESSAPSLNVVEEDPTMFKITESCDSSVSTIEKTSEIEEANDETQLNMSIDACLEDKQSCSSLLHTVVELPHLNETLNRLSEGCIKSEILDKSLERSEERRVDKNDDKKEGSYLSTAKRKGDDQNFVKHQISKSEKMEEAQIEEAQIEELQTEEVQTEEAQIEELQAEEAQIEELQIEEAQIEELQTEELQTEELQTEEAQTEEAQIEELQIEELQAEELQTEELQTEEAQTEEVQIEELQTEELQTEEAQIEELQAEEVQIEEAQIEELQAEELQIEELQTEELQIEEAQIEEAQIEELQTEELQIEELQTEELQIEEAQIEELQIEELQTEELQIEELQAEELQIEELQAEELQIEEVQIEEAQVEEAHSSMVKENQIDESPMSKFVVDENGEEIEVSYANIAEINRRYEIEYQKEQEELKRQEALKLPRYPFYETSCDYMDNFPGDPEREHEEDMREYQELLDANPTFYANQYNLTADVNTDGSTSPTNVEDNRTETVLSYEMDSGVLATSSGTVNDDHPEAADLSEAKNENLFGAKNEDLSGVEDEDLSGLDDEDLSGVKNEDLSGVENEDLSGLDDEDLSGVDDEDLSGVKNEDLSRLDDEDLSGVKNEDLSEVENEDLSGVDDEDLSRLDDEDPSGVKNEDLFGVENKDLSKVENKDLSGVKNEELSGVENEDLSGVENKDLSGVKNEDLSKVENEDLSGVENKDLSGLDDEDLSGVKNEDLSKVENEDLSDSLSGVTGEDSSAVVEASMFTEDKTKFEKIKSSIITADDCNQATFINSNLLQTDISNENTIKISKLNQVTDTTRGRTNEEVQLVNPELYQPEELITIKNNTETPDQKPDFNRNTKENSESPTKASEMVVLDSIDLDDYVEEIPYSSESDNKIVEHKEVKERKLGLEDFKANSWIDSQNLFSRLQASSDENTTERLACKSKKKTSKIDLTEDEYLAGSSSIVRDSDSNDASSHSSKSSYSSRRSKYRKKTRDRYKPSTPYTFKAISHKLENNQKLTEAERFNWDKNNKFLKMKVNFDLPQISQSKIENYFMTSSGDRMLNNLQPDPTINNSQFRCFVRDNNVNKVKQAFESSNLYNLEHVDGSSMTVLMIASISGYHSMVQILCHKGAKVNAQTVWGRTSLMFAAEKGHEQILHTLLYYGANVTIQTKNGESALLLAINKNHQSIARTLLCNGAYAEQNAFHFHSYNECGKMFKDYKESFDESLTSCLTKTCQKLSFKSMSNPLMVQKTINLNDEDFVTIDIPPTYTDKKMFPLLFAIHSLTDSSDLKVTSRLSGPSYVTGVFVNGVWMEPTYPLDKLEFSTSITYLRLKHDSSNILQVFFNKECLCREVVTLQALMVSY